MNARSLGADEQCVADLGIGESTGDKFEHSQLLGGEPLETDRIVVDVTVNEGQPAYTVALQGKPLIGSSRLGVVRDDADFSVALAPAANYSKRLEKLEKVDTRYELLTSKRRNNTYRANRRVLELQTASGARMDIVDDVANRLA